MAPRRLVNCLTLFRAMLDIGFTFLCANITLSFVFLLLLFFFNCLKFFMELLQISSIQARKCFSSYSRPVQVFACAKSGWQWVMAVGPGPFTFRVRALSVIASLAGGISLLADPNQLLFCCLLIFSAARFCLSRCPGLFYLGHSVCFPYCCPAVRTPSSLPLLLFLVLQLSKDGQDHSRERLYEEVIL
jgi:hypothetical protein